MAYSNIKNFQVSKEGSAKKAMIRLAYADRSDRVTLDFGARFSDRDAIRDVLNRLQSNGTAAITTTPANESQQTQPTPKTKPVSREEFARRAKLMAHKDVRKLHAQLVGGNVVSDDDFWAAMRWRYKDNGEPRGRGGLDLDEGEDNQDIEMTGERGVPSDAFVAEDGGPGQDSGFSPSTKATDKWTSNMPTPAQRHIVFMEKPAVARAFNEKVKKGTMGEAQFWTLFIASSLAGRRIGRMTKSDITRTAEADAMFAPFEAAEKRFAPHEAAERARSLAHELDLEHADDHRGVHIQDSHRTEGDAPRGVKRGRDAAAEGSSGLRLMRLVNRHGELVLNEGGVGGWVAEGIDKVRPLEDLELDIEKPFSKLGVKRFRSHSTGEDEHKFHVDLESCRTMNARIAQWIPNVDRFQSSVPGSDSRLEELLESMRP